MKVRRRLYSYGLGSIQFGKREAWINLIPCHSFRHLWMALRPLCLALRPFRLALRPLWLTLQPLWLAL